MTGGAQCAAAVVYCALDDRQRGLHALNEAVDARSGMLLWLKNAPDFDRVAADPQAKALLDQVGGLPAM
jgi:hypothetical protein